MMLIVIEVRNSEGKEMIIWKIENKIGIIIRKRMMIEKEEGGGKKKVGILRGVEKSSMIEFMEWLRIEDKILNMKGRKMS